MAIELPYMPFYPADHLRDTRILSLAARGAWMDLVCAMWHPRTRGILAMRLAVLSRLLGIPTDETEEILLELIESGIADITRSGNMVTITSRRVTREWKRAVAFRTERAEAGRRGAEKRWANRRSPELPLEVASANATLEPEAVPPPPAEAPEPAAPAADGAPRDLAGLNWCSLSGDEALALLGQHFPDRDVWGEYQRFKQVRADQGRKPDWRGLISWLRKSAPIADLGRKKPGRSAVDPPDWPAWLAKTYPKADPVTRFADAPDDVRREFLSGNKRQ